MTSSTRKTRVATITRNLDVVPSVDGQFAIGIVTELSQLKTVQHVQTDLYRLRRIPSDVGGVAVEVAKQSEDGETYHVHLGRELGDSCDCPAGTYRGVCRHLDMVREAHHLGLV
jgi:hypothetical protein